VTWCAAVAVLALAACHTEPRAPTTPSPDRGATEVTMDPSSELAVLRPYAGSTDPEALAALDREVSSNDAFDDAVAAFHAGEYARAARRFLDAAEPLLGARTAWNGDVMADNRLACYTNAQRAFQRAGAVDEGIAALSAAEQRDPDHAEALRALVKLLRR
jgi:hypothetical protein